ncbi:hypothetical protein AOLI_G00271190 [Acnodon oligacanthus]
MARISVQHEELSCPVCLDLLKDPVTINCGHSFCKVCINRHWDQDDQRGVYSCPQCRQTFTPRPVLCRNNMLAEVVEKLKKTELRAAPPAPRYAGPGDVACDFCTGRKLKAIKSCLTCLASFCETHLKPHSEVPGLKKHKLVKASSQLQEKICSQHDEVMKIYCRTDRSCICYLCTMAEHKGHSTVPAAIERTKKQNQLKEIQSQFQQRIQEKQKEQQELKQAVETLKRCAQSAVEDSERIFTELIRSIEKKRSEVTELIRAQEEAELSGAEELLEKVEQEIADLQRRQTELEQLSHTEDHIHFLQSFQSLCVSSGSEDSPSITVHQHLSFDGVRRSLSELKERLEELCREEFSKIPPQGKRSCPAVEQKDGNLSLNRKSKAVAVQILSSEPKNKELLQCMDFCQLTLDPNTAFCRLILSEKNRVVTRVNTEESSDKSSVGGSFRSRSGDVYASTRSKDSSYSSGYGSLRSTPESLLLERSDSMREPPSMSREKSSDKSSVGGSFRSGSGPSRSSTRSKDSSHSSGFGSLTSVPESLLLESEWREEVRYLVSGKFCLWFLQISIRT